MSVGRSAVPESRTRNGAEFVDSVDFQPGEFGLSWPLDFFKFSIKAVADLFLRVTCAAD